MKTSPQFTRQASRPLALASYRAAARKLRQYALALDLETLPSTPRERAALTRVVHSLAYSVRSLRERHDRLGGAS